MKTLKTILFILLIPFYLVLVLFVRAIHNGGGGGDNAKTFDIQKLWNGGWIKKSIYIILFPFYLSLIIFMNLTYELWEGLVD